MYLFGNFRNIFYISYNKYILSRKKNQFFLVLNSKSDRNANFLAAYITIVNLRKDARFRGVLICFGG